MSPVAKAMPIVSLLFGLSVHHGKKYCYPAQKKILELLLKRSGIKMSIATLNRWLRVIEDERYVRRIRRIRRDKKLGMVFQSTLYIINYQGYMLLYRAGVQCWDKLRELAADAKRKLSPVAREVKKSEPEGEGMSLANHRKKHPEIKLPWNGKEKPA